ncbi:hypothetical protein J3P95_14415 [Pseudomonas sp. Z5-35]|uniref:hypothetical protein n=1 Tax=unclassified Pseudomonas TaxID=196821 RepID=UPI003DA7E5D6
MNAKGAIRFIPESELFPKPIIKQASNGTLTSQFLDDCSVVASLPSKTKLEGKIICAMSYVGGMMVGSTDITDEMLKVGYAFWETGTVGRPVPSGTEVRLITSISQKHGTTLYSEMQTYKVT